MQTKARRGNFHNIKVALPTQVRPAFAFQTVLPLRIFLGVAFLAAGLDKLFNPSFLTPDTTGYIGNQLEAFARISPISDLITSLAIPNAKIVGLIVMLGEIAIGLGTLTGFLTRTAGVFGFLLSLILWVSSSWQVTPFFLVLELPYAIGWLTLTIAGADPLFSLDSCIKRWLMDYRTSHPKNDPKKLTRRNLLIKIGPPLMFGTGGILIWATLPSIKGPIKVANTSSKLIPGLISSKPATIISQTDKIENYQELATLAALTSESFIEFVTPDTKEKAILVQSEAGVIRAFSITCTHLKCEVSYFKSPKLIQCPCHGSTFDMKTGMPTKGPATLPLKRFNVKLEGDKIVYQSA